jgi:hypothetical protein
LSASNKKDGIEKEQGSDTAVSGEQKCKSTKKPEKMNVSLHSEKLLLVDIMRVLGRFFVPCRFFPVVAVLEFTGENSGSGGKKNNRNRKCSLIRRLQPIYFSHIKARNTKPIFGV